MASMILERYPQRFESQRSNCFCIFGPSNGPMRKPQAWASIKPWLGQLQCHLGQGTALLVVVPSKTL